MKRIYTKKTQNLSLAILSAIFFAITSNCFAMPFFKEKLPTTPYALPIDISKKGNKAEIDLRIKSDKERKNLEPKTVAFELKFVPYDPEDDPKSKYYISSFRKNLIMIGALRKYFEPQRTKEERKEISADHNRLLSLMEREELISSGTGATYKSQWIKHKGIPIPNIRLTITDLNDPDKKVVYDEVLEVKKHWQIAGYFYKYLDHIKLNPGSYKITAEVTSDAPAFEGADIRLIIGSYFLK